MEIIWILVNNNSIKEAKSIGDRVLKARLAACYSLVPKLLNKYYWPPRGNKFETNKGPLLVLETLPKNFQKIALMVKKLHSDRVPFIGKVKIALATKDFYEWMRDETR